MLDERKINAALMKAQGIDVIKIAPAIGISRATYYNWEKTEEFTAEVDKFRQEFLTQGSNMISYLSIKALKKLDSLMDAESEKVQFDAASKILDKSHSNATKIDINDGRSDKDVVPVDVLDQVFKDADSEADTE